ncbi:MAG: cyclodeaminase/cyclohydrolase family protein [Planctomycetota bacterium]|nr:cyclodeaminase/cyclohydrolase family protein [Planctomycetota bacterium]
MEKDNLLNMSVTDFIAATASKTPTPGGGSVAGVVGALGVALGEMALNFTRGKKKFAEHEELYAHLGDRLERARRMFQDLVADDVAAYKLYQATMRQEDSPEKDQAVQLATAAAIDVPREATKLALAVLADLLELSARCNPYLITDLLAAAVLAAAAAKLSDFNVRINIPQVDDKKAAEEIRKSSADDLAKATELLETIEQATKKLL